jgi:hypothetical protein
MTRFAHCVSAPNTTVRQATELGYPQRMHRRARVRGKPLVAEVRSREGEASR